MNRRPARASTRRTALLLGAALVVAVVVRGVVFDQLLDSPWGGGPLLDERITHLQAASMARNDDGPVHDPPGDTPRVPLRKASASPSEPRHDVPLEFPPVPAFVLSLAYRAVGVDPGFARVVSFVGGVVVVGAVFFAVLTLTRRRKFAFVAALATALQGPLILSSTVGVKTSLVAAFVAVFAACLVRRGVVSAVVAGACVAAAVYSQGQALPLLLAASAWLLLSRSRRRRFAAFVAGVVVVVAPIAVAQQRRGLSFPWLPVQSGQNLYYANQPGVPGPFYRPTPFSSSDPALQFAQLWIAAEAQEGRELTAAEADRRWRDAAIAGMRADPLEMVKRVVYRVFALFHSRENCDHYSLATVAKDVPALAAPWLPSSLPLLAALLLSPWALRQRRARALVTGLAGVAAIFLLTSPTARYRAVFVPVCVVVAAAGAARVRGGRVAVGVVVGVVVATVVVDAVVVPGDDDSGADNVRASVLERAGRVREARALRAAVAASGGVYADYARLALGDVDGIGAGSIAEAAADVARCAAGVEGAAEFCAAARRLQPGSVEACRASVVVGAATDADCDALAERLARRAPWWRPGVRPNGSHGDRARPD